MDAPSRTFVDKNRLQNELQNHLERKHCDELLNLKSLEAATPSNLAEKLMKYHNTLPTLRRIPKGARFSATDKFAKLLDDCVNKNSIYS